MSVVKNITANGATWRECPSTTISNSVAETTILSVTIPGKDLDLYKLIRYEMYCNLTSIVVPPTVTIKVKYGSGVLTAVSALTININQNSQPFIIEGVIVNRNLTNSQYAYSKVSQHATQGPLALTSPIYDARTTFAIDSTTDQTFAITTQFGGLIATTSLVIDYWKITIE